MNNKDIQRRQSRKPKAGSSIVNASRFMPSDMVRSGFVLTADGPGFVMDPVRGFQWYDWQYNVTLLDKRKRTLNPGLIIPLDKKYPGYFYSNEGHKVEFDDMGEIRYVEHSSGTKAWIKNKKLHREGDLPAIQYRNGSSGWYLSGKAHRESAPAFLLCDGHRLVESWFLNGKLHRVDGPAYLKTTETGLLLEEKWAVCGAIHREGGPAIISLYNGIEWWQNGLRHRTDGPAIERYPTHRGEWWIKGKRFDSKENWIESMSEEEFHNYIFSPNFVSV